MNETPRIVAENKDALEALADSDLRTSGLAQSILDHFDLGGPEEITPAGTSNDESEPIRGVLEF